MIQAIVLTSFGTSHLRSRERAILALERETAAAFPDIAVIPAYTSRKILRILRERDGLDLQTDEEALKELVQNGVQRVLLQPTHVICGEEYDKLLQRAATFSDSFEKLDVGTPLLDGAAAVRHLSKILARRYPHDAGRAVILVGHGTEHRADSIYDEMFACLRGMGREDMFLATVEGARNFAHTAEMAAQAGCAQALLVPLMLVAGDHAANDMAGQRPDSLKNLLAARGIAAEAVMHGLGEYPEVRSFYVEKMRGLIH